MMATSYSKNLVDCISWFSSSPDDSVKSDLVERYNQELCDIFMLSKPVLEDILSSEIASDGDLDKILQELTNYAVEARKLEKGWHQMMSKFHFVLEIESVITKIRTLFHGVFNLFRTSFQSIEQCYFKEYPEKMLNIPCQRVSEVIRSALQEQIENLIPRAELIEKIEDSLKLSRNEEFLIEIIALDNLKSKTGYRENLEDVEFVDRLIELVTYMHDCYVEKYQVHNINNVPIPADFCCPLSLELMFDPVIVASGQTYERAFIKKWLDQGFTTCPKTRQVLSHTNLIPNYTVKALIANWCETNNIKFPDPAKSINFFQKDVTNASADRSAGPSDYVASKSNMISRDINRNSLTSNGHSREAHLDDKAATSHLPNEWTGQPLWVADESGVSVGNLPLTNANENSSSLEMMHGDSELTILNKPRYHSNFPDDGYQGLIQSTSASNTRSTRDHHGAGNDDVVSRVPSDLTHYSSDASGELTQASSSTSHREPESPTNLDVRSRSNNFRRRSSDRFGLRLLSSSLETRHNLAGVEAEVRKLVEDLKSDSLDEQRTAATDLRHLAKHSTENRIIIASCGAIPQLVSLLRSEDPKTQENAVTALLNLSINDNNKMAIANADAINPLIYVLQTGTAEAKENSAATLFSLSVIEENKAKIGRSGAIIPLVELLGSGTPRGKKDAATALFNLSIFHENKSRIVQAGAVKYLVELMDPAAGMVDKAVAVLANLATIPEGKSAIGREGGIPYLVEVVELGSARGKENAAAALLQLCTTSSKFSSLVLQEGVIPPLVALSQSGTPRAKEKAQSLLAHFRSQRHVNPGRP